MTGLIAFLLRMSATVIAVLSRTDELVDGRRPRRVSVLPLVFALAVTGALMDAGFKGAFDQRRATTPPPVSPVADPSAASAPMYPGPPSGAPLPKLDLLIVFDYGPGPRHPTPGPGPPSLPQASLAVGRLPPSGVPPTPSALQLRLLQTVVDVAAEKNSTLVMPFPVELLRFFDRLPGLSSQAESAEASAGAANGHGTVPLGSEEAPAA